MKTTQKQIAKYAGVSERTVRNWSKGRQLRTAAMCAHKVNLLHAKLVGMLHYEIFAAHSITKKSIVCTVSFGAMFLSIDGVTEIDRAPINERNLNLAISKIREVISHV